MTANADVNHDYLPARLTLENACVEIIESILKVLRAKPTYVRPEDLARHVAMLQDFRAFITDEDTAQTPLPLTLLDDALAAWVLHKTVDEFHPLMASYALDTGRLIEAHVAGHEFFSLFGRKSWPQIPAMVAGYRERFPRSFACSDLKRALTCSLGTVAEVTIPPSAYLQGEQRLCPAGRVIHVRISRCHLSRGDWNEYTSYRVVHPEAGVHDLGDEFKFYASLLPTKIVEGLLSNNYCALDEPLYPATLYIPGAWITAAFTSTGRKPVPSWPAID